MKLANFAGQFSENWGMNWQEYICFQVTNGAKLGEMLIWSLPLRQCFIRRQHYYTEKSQHCI